VTFEVFGLFGFSLEFHGAAHGTPKVVKRDSRLNYCSIGAVLHLKGYRLPRYTQYKDNLTMQIRLKIFGKGFL
jgi:hypothetical protein